MKILVAHPDKQHSYRLAAALKKQGYLQAYITTVYDKEGSLTNKVKNLLKGKNLKKASSRRTNELNDNEVILYCEIFNLFIIFLSRFPSLLNLCRILRMKLADRFGVKVAKKAIKENCDIVIMYDSTALSCFKYLSKHNNKIIRILDTSTVSHSYMKKTFDKEIELTGIKYLKKEFSYLWNEKLLKRYDDEIKFSNYFLAPSRVVHESLIYSKVKENQILHVPYGVDIDKFNPSINTSCDGKLKLVFVGQVTCRKGINHLLEVISNFDKNKVELFIAGAYDKNSEWYNKYCDYSNINFLGFVTHDKIVNLYQSADLFVLPSLAEGMALVGLEALASGLPVICSQYSGIDDLIENKKNGFVYNVFDNDSFNNIIEWCLINREKLKIMKLNARSTAENYTWSNYEKNVVSALNRLNNNTKN